MLGHLFSMIPHGSVAWRVNLSAATCGALAAGFLASAVVLWTCDIAAAFVAAALFSLSSNVWLYSIQGEVFALNNLFVCATLFLSIQYCMRKGPLIAYCGAFVIGMALTNQHTTLLSAAPMAIGILIIGRKTLLNPPAIMKLVLCFFIGLVPVLNCVLVMVLTACALGLPVPVGCTASGWWVGADQLHGWICDTCAQKRVRNFPARFHRNWTGGLICREVAQVE